MKDISTPVPPKEVRAVIKKSLENAALVNYERLSEEARIEGELAENLKLQIQQRRWLLEIELNSIINVPTSELTYLNCNPVICSALSNFLFFSAARANPQGKVDLFSQLDVLRSVSSMSSFYSLYFSGGDDRRGGSLPGKEAGGPHQTGRALCGSPQTERGVLCWGEYDFWEEIFQVL